MPRSGAAVACDLEDRRRKSSPPAAAQLVPPRHDARAASVSVPEGRRLRERVELAAPAPAAAGPKADNDEVEAVSVIDEGDSPLLDA
jgi:hypothetical protein